MMLLADERFQQATQFADEPHILTLAFEVGGVHLDELANEDPRPRVILVSMTFDVGHGGPDEIIHELQLTADRRAELREPSLIRHIRVSHCGNR